MMGGRVFMVNDKKKQMDLLMARVGETATEKLIHKKACHPYGF